MGGCQQRCSYCAPRLSPTCAHKTGEGRGRCSQPPATRSSMRPWGSVSRQCETCCAKTARCMVARQHTSPRCRVEVARAEHAENVRWSKLEEARGVLEQPPFVDGTTADSVELDSLDAYLQARQWHHPGGPARRFLSHLLTYPLTLASGVREARLGGPPAPSALAQQKEHAASSAVHGNDYTSGRSSRGSDSSDSKSRDSDSMGSAIDIVCLGARAESTMPPSFWREALFALPGVSRLSLHLIGPELGMPPGVASVGQAGRATTARDDKNASEQNADLSSAATHATALSVGDRVMELRWTRAMLGQAPAGAAAAVEEEKEAVGSTAAAAAPATVAAVEKTVADADAFVLFNPGLGHPHLREGWAGALKRLLDTGKPIIVSCHSEADLERDARLLREAGAEYCRPEQATTSGGAEGGVSPRKNPFRSLMVSEDPLAAPGQGELVSCNWGVILVRGIGGEAKGVGGSSSV